MNDSGAGFKCAVREGWSPSRRVRQPAEVRDAGGTMTPCWN